MIEENIFKLFNNAEITAIKNINGQIKEIMELSKIKLEYHKEYNNDNFKAMGTRVIQRGKPNIYLTGNAEVNYISEECHNILIKTYGSLSFKLPKKNNKNTIILYCSIEDAEDLTVGDNITFKVQKYEEI